MTGKAKLSAIRAANTWRAAMLFGIACASAGTLAGTSVPRIPVPLSQADLPERIETPGTYVLASDLAVSDAETTAIEIDADDVTIDLAGHAIRGPVICTRPPVSCAPQGMGNGIHAVGHDNVTVANGFVTGMGRFGIALEGSGNRIEQVRVAGNGAAGILAFGAAIGASIVEGNGAEGLAGIDIDLQGSIVRDNRGVGMAAYGHSHYLSSIFSGNNGGGVQVDAHTQQGNGNLCNATACP